MSQSKEDLEKVSSPTSSSQDESSQKEEATTSKEHSEPATQMEIEVEGPQRSQNDKESPIPSDNKPTSSKVNESEPSSSGCNKAKKSQANGGSRISMEKSGNSSDEDSNKCQKSSDGCNTSTQEDESETDILSMFRKLKPKVKKRNYRSERSFYGDDSDSHNDTSNEDCEIMITGRSVRIRTNVLKRMHRKRKTIDDGEDENDEDEVLEDSEDESTAEDRINYESSSSGGDGVFVGFERGTLKNVNKEKPKPGWLLVPQLVKREIGINPLFRRRFYGSLRTVQRLEIMYIFAAFEGCVNALNFNQKGDLLASGSDDTSVVILNWAPGKKHSSFESGHRSNVFQTKWLLFDVQNLIATCARDGEVRLLDINHGVSRKIGVHYAPTHKLGLHIDTPHVIISVGEDARVLSIDIRDNVPTRLLVVQDGDYNVPLYSVHMNPVKGNEFCVTGRSQTVRVYDRRKVSKPLYTLCPQHLYDNKLARVTCAVYNYNGTEILASYSDEDIYLFDAVNPEQGEFAHRYQGHRNSATVKGVNYFGPKSEYVISGSDCGSIYIWEKNTEAVVQWMRGDEHGVVNCLEPHPHIPILATSGLDDDVKVWAPSYPIDTAFRPKNSDRRGIRYKQDIEYDLVDRYALGRLRVQMIRSFIRCSYGNPRLSRIALV